MSKRLRFYPIELTPTEIREAVAALGPTGTRAEARVKAAAHGMADAIEAVKMLDSYYFENRHDFIELAEAIASEYARLRAASPHNASGDER